MTASRPTRAWGRHWIRTDVAVRLVSYTAFVVCALLLILPTMDFLTPGSAALYTLEDRLEAISPWLAEKFEEYWLVLMLGTGFVSFVVLPMVFSGNGVLGRVPQDQQARRGFMDRDGGAGTTTRTVRRSGLGIRTTTTRTTTRTTSGSSLSLHFDDDGSIVPVAGGPVRVNETQLRALAREAGVPWDEYFATPGGARALIAIFAASQQPSRTSPTPAGSAGAGAQRAGAESTPQPPPAGSGHPGGSAEDSPFDAADTPWTYEDIADSDPTRADPAPYSGTGSVYTSTSLYESSRLPATGSVSWRRGFGAGHDETRPVGDDQDGTEQDGTEQDGTDRGGTAPDAADPASMEESP